MAIQMNKQIEALKNRLRNRFDIRQIIIFGSQVHGTADSESDIDLCVIADLKDRRKLELIREIRRELLDIIPNSLDILVYDEEEFEERASLKNTLEHKIGTDGMRVYGD